MSSLFDDKFEIDDREPVIYIHIPYLGKFGLTSINLNFWLQSFLLLSFQSVINVIAAVSIYYLIVKTKRPSLETYMIGYGFICPVLLLLPFYIIRAFDLRNMAFILCVAGATPALLVFRCIEAMHDTMPQFAKQSMSKFILYYSTSLQLNFDPKSERPMPVSRTDLIQKAVSFVALFIQTTFLYSLLFPCDYRLFAIERNHLFDLFHWKNILNNYLMACLTGATLESGATGLGLLTSIMTGHSVMEFNDSPLTKSTSVSDFWGKRWDKIVAGGLRRGIFYPLRKSGYSREISAILTFVCSGFLHEFMLIVMAARKGTPNNPSGEPYSPRLGYQFIFFLWNGLLLLGEYTLVRYTVVKKFSAKLPSFLRTTLVLLLVLPVSHLFTDHYIESCFYSDIALGFPRVIYVHTATW